MSLDNPWNKKKNVAYLQTELIRVGFLINKIRMKRKKTN